MTGSATTPSPAEKMTSDLKDSPTHIAHGQAIIEHLLATPREEIFKEMPEAAASFRPTDPVDLDKSDVVCIRHAVSCANMAQQCAMLSKFQPGASSNPLPADLQSFDVIQDVGGARSLADCPLHPYGLEQTGKQGEKLHGTKFHTVLVSPLRRTMQTASFLFRNHPEKDRIRFLVYPHVREWVRHTDGVNLHYRRLKWLFDKANPEVECALNFDWSLMDEWVQSLASDLPEDQIPPCVRNGEVMGAVRGSKFLAEDYWVCATVEDEEARRVLAETVQKAWEGNYNGTGNENTGNESTISPDLTNATYAGGKITDLVPTEGAVADGLMACVRNTIPRPLENYFSVMRRAETTVKFLRKYMGENGLLGQEGAHQGPEGRKKIGIVAHYRFLDGFFAAGRDKATTKVEVTAEKIKGGYLFKNCEIVGWPMGRLFEAE